MLLRLIVMLGFVAALYPLAGSGASEAGRIIDRTVECAVADDGTGWRQLDIQAQSGVREGGASSAWFALPHVSIYPANGVSVGIQAGGPKSPTGQPQPRTTFWQSLDGCRVVRTKLPLTPRGLVGGRASRLLERYRCTGAKLVRVRVRLEMRSPAPALKQESRVLFTNTPVRAGSMAVRTGAGRPLAYADVLDSGRVRLYLAKACTES